jgi:hypothetical protein
VTNETLLFLPKSGLVRMMPSARRVLDEGSAYAVQVEVHGAQTARHGHELEVAGEAALEVSLLIRVEILTVLAQNVFVGTDKEASGTASRVADGVVGAEAHDVHGAFYELAS